MRPRKRHVQQDLVFSKRGGKRRGAGRKPTGKRAGTPHTKRRAFHSRTPFSITLSVIDDVAKLRTPHAYRAFWRAAKKVYGRTDFRIIDMTLEYGHMHLTVEADNRCALSSGMQAFKISAAKNLNRELGRKGHVFRERYYEVRITCPTQARNARAYVLLNWRRHREDRNSRWFLDPYSSAVSFTGWANRTEPFKPPANYNPLPVHQPRTWLMAEGWKRRGLIDLREVPGPRYPRDG